MKTLPTTFEKVMSRLFLIRAAAELAERIAGRLESQATTQHALLYGCLVGVLEQYAGLHLFDLEDVATICRIAVPEFKSDQEVYELIKHDADSYANHGINANGEKAMTEIYFKLLKFPNPS